MGRSDVRKASYYRGKDHHLLVNKIKVQTFLIVILVTVKT